MDGPACRGVLLRGGIRQAANGLRSGRPDMASSRQPEFRCRYTPRVDGWASSERDSRRIDVWLSALFSRKSRNAALTAGRKAAPRNEGSPVFTLTASAILVAGM